MFCPICRHRFPEFRVPDATRQGVPVPPGVERGLDDRVGEPERPKVLADPDRALAATGMRADEVLSEPCVVENSIVHELRDHGRDRSGVEPSLLEPGRKLGAREIPSRKVPRRRGGDRRDIRLQRGIETPFTRTTAASGSGPRGPESAPAPLRPSSPDRHAGA